MPNFDPERFSQNAYDRALDRELANLQRALYLIQQNFTMQIYAIEEQMKSDIQQVSLHIVALRNFIDADTNR